MSIKQKPSNYNDLASEYEKNPTTNNLTKLNIALCQIYIDSLFEKAKEQGNALWPDQAVFEAMAMILKGQSSKPVYPNAVKILSSPAYKQAVESRDMMAAYFREIHAYAFKSFYKTYGIIKRGRRRLPESLLSQVLSLAKQGKTTAEQAKEQGLPIGTPEERAKSKDVARHRRRTAKKRLGSK